MIFDIFLVNLEGDLSEGLIMKKIFILMCLILGLLTAQNAYAACKIEKSANKKVVTSCTKTSDSKTEFIKETYPQEAMRYKKYVMQKQMERATVYNALNLTDEQIQLKECLIQENSPLYEQKFDELMKASCKLQALEDANASAAEINSQKRIIKKTKKDIEKIVKKENKTFKKSLTSLQRSKYNMIKKLEKNDYKEAQHRKDYYKSNPQLRPFGDPARYACPIGRDE